MAELRALMRWRAVAVLASLIVGIALAELAVRWVQPVSYRQPPRQSESNPWRALLHRRSLTPGLSYELVPGARGSREEAVIQVNSLGMRDDEPVVRTAGSRRILVVGDSMTFGFRVPAGADTYPNVLERLLNAEEPRVRTEVLNMGVGGYSARDEAAVVVARAPALKPDLVLVGYCLNDPEIDPIQPLHAYFTGVAWWQHWHLLRWLAQTRNQAAIQRFGSGSYYHYLHREPRKWGSVVAAFGAIRDAANQGEFRVLLAILPILPEPGNAATGAWKSSYGYADIHRQVAAAGRRLGFEVVDLYPGLAALEPEALRSAPDDFHPSVEAHRWIAELLRPTVLTVLRESGAKIAVPAR